MTNLFIKKVNKIILLTNHNKRIQRLGELISYPNGTGPGRVSTKEFIKQPKVKKVDIMITFDNITGRNMQEHNSHKFFK